MSKNIWAKITKAVSGISPITGTAKTGDKFALDTNLLGGTIDEVTNVTSVDTVDVVTSITDTVTVASTGDGVVSTANSSAVALTTGATFTGTGEDVSIYASVAITVISDAVSAINGLSIEQSSDNTNWDLISAYSVLASTTQQHTIKPTMQYFRVVYSNADTAQTSFRLQTIFHKYSPRELHGGVEVGIRRDADAAYSRTVNDNNFDRNVGRITFESVESFSGYNDAVGTTEEDITPTGGVYPFPVDAETLRIKSGGDSNDTALGTGCTEVTLVFLDGSYNEVTEALATAGVSASSATSTAGRRVQRAYVSGAGTVKGANTGDITIENSTTNQILAVIKAEEGESSQMVFTIPANKTGYLRDIRMNSAISMTDISLYKRESPNLAAAPFGPKRLVQKWTGVEGPLAETYSSFYSFPGKTDLWMAGKKILGTDDARVSAHMDLSIVDIDEAILFDNSKSLNFDGTNDRLDCGTDTSINFEKDEAFSISLWAKFVSTPTNDAIFSNFNTAAGFTGMEFYISSSGSTLTFRFLATSGGFLRVGSGANLATGVWTNLICTFDGSADAAGATIYKNGAALSMSGSGAVAGSIQTGGNMTIPARMNGTSLTNGNFDEVCFWDKELSAAEVSELYNNGVPTNLATHSAAANRVTWYRMGDGDTYPTITDRVGSNSATMVSMAAGDIEDDTP
jgi:hypothetical protein